MPRASRRRLRLGQKAFQVLPETAALAAQAKGTAFGWDEAECNGGFGGGKCLFDRPERLGSGQFHGEMARQRRGKGGSGGLHAGFCQFRYPFQQKMDDPAKLVMGIHPKDTTSASQPDTVVENSVNHFEHKVKALNHETGDGSKPADAYGVRSPGRWAGIGLFPARTWAKRSLAGRQP